MSTFRRMIMAAAAALTAALGGWFRTDGWMRSEAW